MNLWVERKDLCLSVLSVCQERDAAWFIQTWNKVQGLRIGLEEERRLGSEQAVL